MHSRLRLLIVIFCSVLVFTGLAPQSAFGQPPKKFAGFSPPVIYPIPGTISIRKGDLDGDGDIDIVTADSNTGELSLLLNNGDGSFAPSASLFLGGRPIDSVVTDFNGDGIVDLLVTSTSQPVFAPQGGIPQGGVLIVPGLGGGKFGEFSFFFAGTQPNGIDAGDLDGDGDIDFIVSNQLSANVAVFLNNGDGTPGPPTFVPVGSVPQRVRLADMDGDGDLDAVVVNTFSDSLSVLINDGQGALTPIPPVHTNFASSRHLTIGDVNGDGLPDVTFQSSLERLLVHFNKGGSLGEPVFFDVNLRSGSTAIGDIDGDGVNDVVLTGLIPMTGEDEFVRLMRGDGAGGFSVSRLFPSMPGPVGATLSILADLDNDGDMDLALANGSGFAVTVLLNLTNTPSPADLNHDGAVDSADLMLLLGAWGQAGAADLDNSGAVDANDLATLLAKWR